jgi:DNA-binding IscR family transcriptional regulator
MLSKKTKYGKALTFTPKDQTPVAIADIAQSEISHQNFREYFIVVAILVSGSQKRNGGYYLIKAPQEINIYMSVF